MTFITDSSDVSFGNVIGKIQAAINEKYTAGTNLKHKKCFVSIVNGDVRFTSGSRLSTSAIALADPSSGTEPWNVGIVPDTGAMEKAVAAELPDDVVYDKVSYASSKNSSAFLLDDGKGNLSGPGGSGTINYETGEISLSAYPNAEFVVSGNEKAAHSGGFNDGSTVVNGIQVIEARSCNPKADTDIRVISLG